MIILGLAIATPGHHAAALVVDGRVAGAVEEERFNGIKHYGWAPEGRPGDNLCNAPDVAVEDALCRQSVRWVLDHAGLTNDDVDVIAVNGIPYRWHGARECVREDYFVFVPHHLAHAALAARTSPWDRCNVLTIDGRGEYETAAWFTYRGGALERRAELPAGEGRSIGGAYETVTRVLGLGAHGQGQTMALAAFGTGRAERLAEAHAIRGFGDYVLDEIRLQELGAARLGAVVSPDSRAAWDLAADVQAVTEQAMIALAAAGQAEAAEPRWAIAGGVTLNCRANSALRDALGVEVWVPSAAHDAGTALGAALEAAHLLGEPACGPLRHAGLGPVITAGAVEQVLAEAGLRAVAGDAVEAAAQRLADGRVLGWAVGGLEFGPRALGQRSIVAHPGYPGIQDRLNRIKQRQAWRPFGPSVLAEEAAAWFEDAAFGPFMTFTAEVRPERREAVAGIVHVDGSTRPQAVDGAADPAWRRLIACFRDATGVPMVLNTSFNGRGQPLVRTAADALAAARTLGLDGVVLGDRLVDLAGGG